jgi:hypothetical protein
MPDRGEYTTMPPTASYSVSHSLAPEDASDALITATDPTNIIMDDVVEPNQSSQAGYHAEFSSASPSSASSRWSMSPVLGSMYARSASSPLPTRYLRDLKRLESLFGGTSPRGVRNLNEIIELGDSFLKKDAVRFIESFRHNWGQDGLWDRAPLSNPIAGSSVVENVLGAFGSPRVLGMTMLWIRLGSEWRGFSFTII